MDAVFDARRAVPLVPEPESDCCSRVATRLELASRDEAATWLSFLRGLGFVERTERGYARTRYEVGHDELAEVFLDGVYGSREILELLESADGPLPAGAVFERFESNVPAGERRNHPAAWRDTWNERVGDLLDWLVLLGTVERCQDGYVAI